ncbi:hypothetical protein SAMN05421505_12429 [Sinosporangium album]|uniref:Amidohydrolase-related domain-containing protein n=2 Tax=Sinosporangium album TaxID=504805 RepID=A0A1G8FPB4_9ACTN|nr:hypothetical protein SAMN05421505_12429 [Sinosporangium album]
MKNGMIVFDSVVHMTDHRAEFRVHDDGKILTQRLRRMHARSPKKAVPINDSFTDGPPDIAWANEVLWDKSDTDFAMAQTIPLFALWRDGVSPARTNHELAQSNPDRFLFCGGVDPLYQGLRGALDEMTRQVEEMGAVSIKFYQAQRPGHAWRADDRKLAYPLYEKAMELGIKLVQFHKGFPLAHAQIEDLHPGDLQLAAYDFPDLKFGVHHLGGVHFDDMIDVAERFPNVYSILSPLFNTYFQQPRRVYEMFGKALYYIGDKRLCYGTDAFVHPNVQLYIDVLSTIQIPEDLQEGYGYPELTDEGRARILGLNFAEALGVELSVEGDKRTWRRA